MLEKKLYHSSVQSQTDILNIFNAYSNGFFPMGRHKNDSFIKWINPEKRAIIPIGEVYCSKRLKRYLKKEAFEVSFNQNFLSVIQHCANRPYTWINPPIFDLFIILNIQGYAHSVEIKQNGTIVGGLYGLALGSVFFAESMFSRVDNASKAALIAMMAKLNYGGFKIFDAQFQTPHLERMGAIEVIRNDFLKEVKKAVADRKADFNKKPGIVSWEDFIANGTKKQRKCIKYN